MFVFWIKQEWKHLAVVDIGRSADDLLGAVAFAFLGPSPVQVLPIWKLSSGLVQFRGARDLGLGSSR